MPVTSKKRLKGQSFFFLPSLQQWNGFFHLPAMAYFFLVHHLFCFVLKYDAVFWLCCIFLNTWNGTIVESIIWKSQFRSEKKHWRSNSFTKQPRQFAEYCRCITSFPIVLIIIQKSAQLLRSKVPDYHIAMFLSFY